MKTKPVLVTLAVVVVAATLFFFIRSRTISRPEKAGVLKFLEAFDRQVKAGNTDSLADFFEVKQKAAVLKHLINVLTNKSSVKEGESPLFNLLLDVDQSRIRIINTELAQATIPVRFTNDSIPTKNTTLKLKVHKAGNSYKIVQVDANKMMADYLAYNTLVKGKTLTDADIYSAITLKSFETAKQLKTKYDTVVWFAHDSEKTYFYVVKGKWDEWQDIFHYKDTVIEHYGMGLVGPDMKEIIPAEYDLIHNISGTFPGLVEVEKGGKRGFFDLSGKNVIPVNYEQIYPIDDEASLAVLRKGSDYFYLKKDMSVSDKVDLKITDFFSKIRMIGSSFSLSAKNMSAITEYNSREKHGAVFIAPSYLADLNMIGKIESFKNPLRKALYEEVHTNYKIGSPNEAKDEKNWLVASFYSIRDYFIGGRGEFYDTKNIVIIDKKRDKIYTQNIATDYTREEDGGGVLEGACDVNTIRALNDSLYEVKSGAMMAFDLYDSTKSVTGGPYYHYLVVRNNKLVELPDERYFGFTKYVKMDDSYLSSCYNLLVGSGEYDKRKAKTIDEITPEMLRFMKNEIYADYGYKFKDKRWQAVFQDMNAYGYDAATEKPKEGNVSVDDSLTVIDKFNINWINQKLKSGKSNTLAAK